ncbi:MAG: hydrogenase maturation protease [Chloroflexota bacterium]|nr:hydrogenase maturation protease [Chloroflexota bacterium]
MAVLIAGVGYQNMRDQSVGPDVMPALSQLDWPAETEILHLHFGPIHVVQWLEERPGHFDRMVFVAAVARGRKPGGVYWYRWEGILPPAEEIQQRIGEAVMGVIDLDNLLIVAQHFRVLPADVIVVEVEPEDTGWGVGFTPGVEAALPTVIETVWRVATEGYYEQPA